MDGYNDPKYHRLDGPRTDAHRIRMVIESAYHHLDEQCLRARRNAAGDSDFAQINREIQLAMGHLATARNLAKDKRNAIPFA
jgi:hypothetical protein